MAQKYTKLLFLSKINSRKFRTKTYDNFEQKCTETQDMAIISEISLKKS